LRADRAGDSRPAFSQRAARLDTVIHLAATIRISRRARSRSFGIRDLAARRSAAGPAPSVRLLQRAGRGTQSRARLLRAKALAEQAVRESEIDRSSSRVDHLRADDPYMTLLARLSLLPWVMPFPVAGAPQFAHWVSESPTA